MIYYIPIISNSFFLWERRLKILKLLYFKDKLESASIPSFEWQGISVLSKKKLFKPSRNSKYQGLLKETFTRRTIKLSRIAHQKTKQVKFQPRLTLITLVSLISFSTKSRFGTEHESTYVFSLSLYLRQFSFEKPLWGFNTFIIICYVS